MRDRILLNRSLPILSATKEESHPSHGMEVSVLEEAAEGAMVGASAAVTAREAAGITFLVIDSATFLAWTDIAFGREETQDTSDSPLHFYGTKYEVKWNEERG